jgi:hypothetical protein
VKDLDIFTNYWLKFDFNQAHCLEKDIVFFNEYSDHKEFLMDYQHKFVFRIPKVCSGEDLAIEIPVQSAFIALQASKAMFYRDFDAYYAIIDESNPQKSNVITINTKNF